MGIGAGLYMYDVVVEKFTFAILFADEFLLWSWSPYVIGQFIYIWVTDVSRTVTFPDRRFPDICVP